MANIYFSVCVNDYDGYGQTTRHLHAAQFETFYGEELHLECTAREMVCDRVGKDRLRVGRRTFPILDYRCYVGNMMWDMALVTPEVANAIADVLRKNGNYEPDSGTEELWNKWDSGAPLFAAHTEAQRGGRRSQARVRCQHGVDNSISKGVLMKTKPLRSPDEAKAFIMDVVQVDENIAPLVRMLNSYSGIVTLGSCGGHKHPDVSIGQLPEKEWFVTFAVSENHAGLLSLKRIACALNFIQPVQLDVFMSWQEGHNNLVYALSGQNCDPQAVVDFLAEYRDMSVEAIRSTVLETVED